MSHDCDGVVRDGLLAILVNTSGALVPLFFSRDTTVFVFLLVVLLS